MTRGDSPDEYLDKLLLPAPRAAEQRGGREETGTICRQRRRRHGERIGAAETCPRARRVAGEGGGAGEYEWAVARLGAAAAHDFNAFHGVAKRNFERKSPQPDFHFVAESFAYTRLKF